MQPRPKHDGGDGGTEVTVGLGPKPAETIEERATASRSLGRSSHGTTDERLETPGDVLDQDEARRTRVFALFTAYFAAPFAGFIVLIAHGDADAKLAHAISIGVLLVGYLIIGIRLRDPARFAVWNILALGGCGALVVGTGFYYWGRFAPILLAVPIGLYSFALGRSLAAALAVALAIVATHMALTILAVTGVVPDVGLLMPSGLTALEDVSIAAYVWFVLIAVVGLARKRRAASAEILGRLEIAIRGIAGREALLLEAKQEIERALEPGGTGRFSGQQISGYTLGVLLGKGAIGEVYEGTSDDGEAVAIKLLSRASLGQAALVKRFYRELEIATDLTTPNVVSVLGVSGADEAIPYLIMERLQGHTLAEYLRQRRKLSPKSTAELMRALCAGIGAAHERGIVHRDLKPRNVFRHKPWGAIAIWKVLDFGVSKVSDGDTLTQGGVVGTPSYMSPEQASGGNVNVRSDIFALGALAYRCLTGQPAFTGRDIPATLFAVAHAMPAQPSRMARIPPAFDTVLAIALAKHADERFATCAELSAAIDAAAAREVSPELADRAAAILADRPWGARGPASST